MVVPNLKAIALRHLPSIPPELRVTRWNSFPLVNLTSYICYIRLRCSWLSRILYTVMQVSVPVDPYFKRIKTAGEVVTLKFVGENTSIPISRVSLESLWESPNLGGIRGCK
jgi:hypothetical protein